MILDNPVVGVANKAHKAVFQVHHSPQRVVDGASGILIQRIHGKIATLGIQRPLICKDNLGIPAIRRMVRPQCGDFIGMTAGIRHNGAIAGIAVLGRNPASFQNRNNFIGG